MPIQDYILDRAATGRSAPNIWPEHAATMMESAQSPFEVDATINLYSKKYCDPQMERRLLVEISTPSK